MNPLNLVADCDNVSLTGDVVDPGTVRWMLTAARTTAARDPYEVTLLATYEQYDPYCHCGPNGGEAVAGAEHQDGCRRPDGDPPEGLYCLAAVVAEYLEGATLHVSGPLRHGWPPCDCNPTLIAPSASPWTCPHGVTWRLGVEGDPYCWTVMEREQQPEIVLRGARTWDEVNRNLAGTGPHPHNAPETWRDDGKCIWKSCGVWRDARPTRTWREDMDPVTDAKVWGVLVWPRRTDNARRVDEYTDRATAERMIRESYGRNVVLVWRHETTIRLDDEAVWHNADCEGTHGHTEPQCDAYLLGPVRRVTHGEIRRVDRTVGGDDSSSAQFTVEDAHRHPHGTPETWDDAGGCTYSGCPVAKLPERCHVDMGAARLGGPRIACGKPLPCPDHTITPAAQAPTDIAQPPTYEKAAWDLIDRAAAVGVELPEPPWPRPGAKCVAHDTPLDAEGICHHPDHGPQQRLQCSHGYTHGHTYTEAADHSTRPLQQAWCEGPTHVAAPGPSRAPEEVSGLGMSTGAATQGHLDDLRTQQEKRGDEGPQAESDVRAPAQEDPAAHRIIKHQELNRQYHEAGRHRPYGAVGCDLCKEEGYGMYRRADEPTREPYLAQFWRARRELLAGVAEALDQMCLVVVYAGSGSPGTGTRVCGQRRPCPDHETVEHDETCQHDDDDERLEKYCGFAYPHQPHLWHENLLTLGCPGKSQTSLYDGPREGVNT